MKPKVLFVCIVLFSGFCLLEMMDLLTIAGFLLASGSVYVEKGQSPITIAFISFFSVVALLEIGGIFYFNSKRMLASVWPHVLGLVHRISWTSFLGLVLFILFTAPEARQMEYYTTFLLWFAALVTFNGLFIFFHGMLCLERNRKWLNREDQIITDGEDPDTAVNEYD